MYCSKCGSPNVEGARFCEKCGNSLSTGGAATWAVEGRSAAGAGTPSAAPNQPPTPQQQWQAPQGPGADPRMRGAAPLQGTRFASGKEPVTALLLSMFLPAIGQFYNGDNKKGAIMLGGYFVSFILWFVYIGFLGTLGIWIWSMVDAYSVASGKTPVW